MATSWALTAEQIVDQACWNLGLAQVGRSVRAEHRTLGLRLLNAIVKSMPSKGYLWPKSSDSEWPFIIQPGSQYVAPPSDFMSSPVIKLYEDEIKAGFNAEDSTSSVGDADTGQEATITSGAVFGIASGKAYLVSGAGILTFDIGVSDFAIGVTLSTMVAADTPGLVFRAQSLLNCLGFFVDNATGKYILASTAAGVPTTIKSYTTPAPASGDIIEVRALGNAITPLVNGVALETQYSSQFIDETAGGILATGTSARFDNLWLGTGKEREVTLASAGAWQAIENHLELGECPTLFHLDAANQIRFHKIPEYFVRGKMFYQATLDDLTTNTAPDLPADMHLTLVHMLTEQLAIPTGRRKQAEYSAQLWREALPEQIALHSDPGDAIFDYDE